MCFHIQITKSKETIEKTFKASFKNSLNFKPSNHINGFDFPKTPVITNKNNKIIEQFNWGLIPTWSKNIEIRKYTLNAKIETLLEKPSYRDAINNRCLIIADGFFEWQWIDDKGKSKQKYLITLSDNSLFAFAGIWSNWVDKKTGEIIKTYSLITTQADEFMSKIHNSKKRMPIILKNENQNNWLEGKNLDFFKIPKINLKASQVF